MSTITNVLALLKQAKPAEIADLDFVKDKFITIHNLIHGSDKGEMIYHKEVFNYKKLLAENAVLRECSQLSLYGCFLDINVHGFSLEGGTKPDCYITPNNFNIGTKDNPVWEKRAVLSVSPYGELKMRMRAGQIKYADNPIVVYEGDLFKVGTNDKGKLVAREYEKNFQKAEGAKIIACFVRIERPDGTYEMPFLDVDAINRLRGYSERKNKGKGNALYTSNAGQIDTGFLMAKTLKHALTSYPKVRTGQFTTLEPLEEIIPGSGDLDYGIDANDYSANGIQDVTHEEVKDDLQQAIEQKSEPATVLTHAANNDDDDDALFN